MWLAFMSFMIGISIIIVAIAKNNKTKNSHSDANETIYVSMERVREVYDEQQHVYRTEVVTDTSNGRRIDGHPLRTREDWDRWSKYDHQAMDCADFIRKCEKELKSSYCADPERTLQLVKDNYSRYESLCTQYGMWNNLIHDHANYIPTADQRQRSAAFIEDIAALVPTAIEKRDKIDEAAAIAIRYLDTFKGKIAYRSDMTRYLSSELEITPSEAGKILRVLYNQNILRESKNEQGRIIVRKVRKKKETTPEMTN